MAPEQITEAERILGYSFDDPELLKRALTHSSFVDSRLDSNERLEFLGDAVLGLVICEHLFENYDHLLEGEMTKIKSLVVSRSTCAEVAAETGLDEMLRLGKGMSNRQALPKSVVAAVYESLIGAIYADGGMEAARAFILRGLEEHISDAATSGHQKNFKSVLQQAVQQFMERSPEYVLLDEKGPDHAKCFEVCVELDGQRFPSSWGASKKVAEQQAALNALLELGLAEERATGEVRLVPPEELAETNGSASSPAADEAGDERIEDEEASSNPLSTGASG